MENWVKVGFGKIDTVPPLGTPIGGYGNDSHRLSTDIRDVTFATAPYEMFCANGMWIKNNSPYDTTFVLTSANGDTAYVASEFAYTYPCYEVESRLFAKGTGEMLAQNLVEMLKEMQ